MNNGLYRPFESYDFAGDKCFLTGEEINASEEFISVFPEWILDRYQLKDKTIVMLAENAVKYSNLKIPCSNKVQVESIDPLEQTIQKAFCIGYEEVKKLPEITLFQWMAKLVYGVLYNDILFGIKQQGAKGLQFRLSPLLTKKIGNLHLMLQSLVRPMEFKTNPWSIEIVPLTYSKDIFNYKDETKNLNFSLGMNGFGIIACLQDNGENALFHKELLEKIGKRPLHAIQFEELWSRFLYSNYLLNTTSEYLFVPEKEKIIVEPVLPYNADYSLFNQWDDKMFAQVLANYWKPWGLTMKDIVSFPDSPISYLINDYNNEFISPESIDLEH